MLITTIIPTKNEIGNIRECVRNAQELADSEVLVADRGSTDGTIEAARESGARVFVEPDMTIAERRNLGVKEALGDFVFLLDADERMTPELARAIEDHARNHKNTAGKINRVNYAFGSPVRFGPLHPGWGERLFPRENVRYEGLVHERSIFDVPVRKLKGDLLHHTISSYGHYVNKLERYAKLWADDAHARGKKSTPLKAILESQAAFFKMFFLKLGILGGPGVWATCFYYACGYTLTKYLLLADKREEEK
jgi:glycosyltransferase involved in cell wall biosynthesis